MWHVRTIHLYLFIYLIIILPLHGIILIVFEINISKYFTSQTFYLDPCFSILNQAANHLETLLTKQMPGPNPYIFWFYVSAWDPWFYVLNQVPVMAMLLVWGLCSEQNRHTQLYNMHNYLFLSHELVLFARYGTTRISSE